MSRLPEPTIERSIHIDADAASVWEHLVVGELASLWMGGVMVIEPRTGGAVTLVPESDPDETLVGLVEEIVPGETLTWTWRASDRDPTQVTIAVSPARDGCLLTVTERIVEYQILEAPPLIQMPGEPWILRVCVAA